MAITRIAGIETGEQFAQSTHGEYPRPSEVLVAGAEAQLAELFLGERLNLPAP